MGLTLDELKAAADTLSRADQQALANHMSALTETPRATATEPVPQGNRTAATWNYTEIAASENKKTRERFETASRETILDALILLRIATYPMARVFEALDVEGHARYGHVSYQSELFPFEDSRGNYWNRKCERVPEGRILEWINTGDVLSENDIQWNGKRLSDAVVLLSASGSDLCTGIMYGWITAFDARNFCDVHDWGTPRVQLDGSHEPLWVAGAPELELSTT